MTPTVHESHVYSIFISTLLKLSTVTLLTCGTQTIFYTTVTHVHVKME